MNRCQHCSVVSHDGVRLCATCARRLYGLLVESGRLWGQLQITITRQSKTSAPQPGGKGTETPLMFDETASEAAWVLRDTLNRWGAEIGLQGSPEASVTARHMRMRIGDLVQLDDAGQCVDEIANAVTLGHKAIDQTVRIYLGPCGCGREMFARDNEGTFDCSCGASHRIDVRRSENLERSRSLVVTDHEAVEYLGAVFGIRIRVSRIRNWGSRWQIPRTRDPESRQHIYRLGDILDMIRDTPSLSAELGDSELG